MDPEIVGTAKKLGLTHLLKALPSSLTKPSPESFALLTAAVETAHARALFLR
jgi:hypothetical protein